MICRHPKENLSLFQIFPTGVQPEAFERNTLPNAHKLRPHQIKEIKKSLLPDGISYGVSTTLRILKIAQEVMGGDH